MIEQEEYIFKQFLLVKNKWYLSDGTTAVNAKEENMAIMLSSFCSWKLGYGFELTKAQLAVVNKLREETDYSDEEAWMEMIKSTKEQLLWWENHVHYNRQRKRNKVSTSNYLIPLWLGHTQNW